MAKEPYKPTGKGKKAKNRLDAVDKKVKGIKGQLTTARITLEKIADPVSEDEKKKKKKRSMRECGTSINK